MAIKKIQLPGAQEASDIHDARIVAIDTTISSGSNNPVTGDAVNSFIEGKGYGTYSKPSGGIPGSDLATAYLPTSGGSVSGNIRITSGLFCLEGIGSTVALSTSRLVLGTPTNQYAYLTGNNVGAFGIYSEKSGTRTGIACYPGQNFFADANSGTIDLGRSNSVWKTCYTTQLSNASRTITVAKLEDNTNKVTSLSSSSTDTQYPSAKCVYNAIGDIETLLAAI